MPEFILDSSGTVGVPYNRSFSNPERMTHFHDLDSFTQGYIEALFFTENEPGTTRDERVTTSGKVRKAWAKRTEEGQQKDMPSDYGFSDLAPKTLESIIKDCIDFQRVAVSLLQRAYESDYSEEQAGRDFWYTRNGHGVGFWDRAELKGGLGDELSALCGWKSRNNAESFTERDVYIGDDGKVYLS